jgi:diguanylate cyclase (GGDEF)-like protein/PAS domain S-box-containing protein
VKTEDILRLIVIDDSSNDTETVSNMLRNAGHAIRAERVEGDEDLRAALGSHPSELILTKPNIPYFSALDALAVVTQQEQDVPVLVLADEVDAQKVTEILLAGARDVVTLSQPERLLHAILREMNDLRERRHARECQRLLHEAEVRARALVDSSRDAIAYVHEGMHIYANEAYLVMFGYSHLVDVEDIPLMDLVRPEDHPVFKGFLRGYMTGTQDASAIDVHGLRADGSQFKITMEFAPATYDGEACSQIVIRDQSVNQELEKKLDDLSKHDLLTGLYNRHYFLDRFKRLVAGDERGYLLSIRPDDFQAVVDTVGIAASDMVLADVAGVLRGCADNADGMLARLEDQIFVAALRGADQAEAESFAKAFLDTIDKHVSEVGGRTVSVTCSIGIAEFNEDIRDAQDVLSRADKARRRAADMGGNQFSLYNPAAEEMAERERAALWGRQLKIALRDGGFRLLFQPIVSLHGDSSENYEVLLRMLDDNGQEITPTEFIPAAEKVGLMGAIDRWVLAHSVKVLAERHRSGKKTNFFIKLSGESLCDEKFLPWLRDLIRASAIPPKTLTLELSESVAHRHLKLLKMLVEGLRQLHVRFALDHFDFSPNWNTLLRYCEAEFLKVDGSLITGIAESPENQAKVKELAAYAKDLGKYTVAQFVENANTLAVLWNCGIDYIQGYFLQGPATDLNYDFTEHN